MSCMRGGTQIFKGFRHRKKQADTTPSLPGGQAPHRPHAHAHGGRRTGGAVQNRRAAGVSVCGRSKSSRNPQPDQTFGSKWATKVKRQVGRVARPHGRTRRRHPCASKGPPSPPAPSVASSRYPRVASRKACDTITSAAGGPCVATGLAAGRTWGSGVRGWQRSAWAVCEAGQQQSGVASALHCSARTELARQRGGSLARWWTGRAGGWGPVPAASAPALAPRLQRRGAVLFVLRLGKAATDGRSVGHPGHSAARARPGPDAVVARVKNNSGVYHLSSSSARPCAMSSFARNGS